MDQFVRDDEMTSKEKLERAYLLQSQTVHPETYEVDESYRKASRVEECHTIHELVEFAKEGKCEIDARVLHLNEKAQGRLVKMDTKQFVESFQNPAANKIKFKEDAFLTDCGDGGGGLALVGHDFTPLLGGPFNKQLYFADYMRMHSAAYYAYNHDPICRQAVQIIRDFTLGRGWRSDCEDRQALAIWESFVEANDLYNTMDMFALETSIYGESMIWWLPNNETKIAYRLGPGQTVPRGMIPRVRLVDPSCIWDIITYPEDITRVLAYQWVAPTQYQTYTNVDATKEKVPSAKFIYQQIPADQMMHFKVNSVSNEKRGRSDLFPVLGYAKRLRDTINYSIIAQQKNAAWSIDTTVEGSQADINAYVQSQQAMGTIPEAGSEFVHSKKITRQYLANQGVRGGESSSFDWCISMIAAGTGIPIGYFGTTHNAGSTRASALVATEPVTKKFEKRRLVYEQALKKMSIRLLKQFGIDAEIEFTFPELVSQDRSSKLKDMALAETQGWIKREKLAPIAAKELEIADFDAKNDMGPAPTELNPSMQSPLTSPGLASAKPSAITNDDRKQVDNNEQ